MKTVSVKLNNITFDNRLQMRKDGISEEKVKEYACQMEAGDQFPPILLYKLTEAGGGHKKNALLLVGGFQRVAAMESLRIALAEAEVRSGTWDEAMLQASTENGTHGASRTNADKRKAIETCLQNPIVIKDNWSDNRVARHCKVSNHLVAEIKKSLTWNSPSENSEETEAEARKYITKHGTEAEMNVSNIGKSQQNSDDQAEEKEAEVVEELPAGEPVSERGIEDATNPVADPEVVNEVIEQGEVVQVLDELGLPIPENLHEAFAAREKFDEMARLARALQKLINEVAQSEGGIQFRRDLKAYAQGDEPLRFRCSHLERTQGIIKLGKPYSVCPWCWVDRMSKSKEPNQKCNACKGQGWVVQKSYEQAGEKILAEVEARAA